MSDEAVVAIIAEVRSRGDAALCELTARFDRLDLTPEGLRFSAEEIAAQVARVSDEDRAALALAAERIRAYHARQMPEDASWTDPEGATLGWRWSAVSAAGLYVPGGQAAYPSSVLMNAIPARVAGVERLVISVPTPGGRGQPAGAAGRAAFGGRRDLPHRRGSGDRGDGLWDRDNRAGGQDHGPGQCLCCRGKAAGLRPGRDRHDRRSLRGAGDRGCGPEPRLAGMGPSGAGRA